MLNRIRRRIDAAVVRRVDARVDARLEEAFANLEGARADYEARLAGNQADFSYIRSEFDRIAPQVAALEQRFSGCVISSTSRTRIRRATSYGREPNTSVPVSGSSSLRTMRSVSVVSSRPLDSRGRLGR